MGDTCSTCKAHGQQPQIKNINLQQDKENLPHEEAEGKSIEENASCNDPKLKESSDATKGQRKSKDNIQPSSSKPCKIKKTTSKKEYADGEQENCKDVTDETTPCQQLSERKEGRSPEMNSLISQPMNVVQSQALGNKLELMPDYFNEITREKLKKLPPFNYNHPEFQIKGAETLGPMEFEDKFVYEGQWKGGKKGGRGKQLWKDGSYYEGYWSNNMANGFGRLIHTDGDTYEGQWLSDRAEGYGKVEIDLGVYSHVCGAVFKGNWKDDKQEGYGEEVWPDGAVYNGHYIRGKKHGKGKFQWSDGSCYEGDFLDNNISGYGRYKWRDGRIFEGTVKIEIIQWVMNKMEGKGVFTWPDGRKYEGQYKNDKKHGFGIFYWPDGRVYKGEWLDGKQHGRGEYKSRKGHIREGIWEGGVRTKWLNVDPNKGSTSFSSQI